MMKLALIGEGIARSQSPDLHQRLGQRLGLPTEYHLVDALELADFDFKQAVMQLQQQGYRGTNVTYPFKEQAVKLATQLSEGVERVGSANTLVFEGGVIRAENTDYSGFISAYRHRFGDKAPGKVLLVGAGGVGRAVAFALGKLGADQLLILERDPSRGTDLCEDLSAQGISARGLTAEEADDLLGQLDGIVNCTPVGHLNHPGCPIDANKLQPQQWVFDAVYIPAETVLLTAAEAAGAATLSGVDLFVYQGVDAFRFFSKGQVSAVQLEAEILAVRDHFFQRLLGA